jgi:hypothetical protein
VTAAGKVDQPASVDVYGALLGTGSDATELLDELVVRAGADPILTWVKQLSFGGESEVLGRPAGGAIPAGRGPHLPSVEHTYLVSKSVFFTRPLPAGGRRCAGGARRQRSARRRVTLRTGRTPTTGATTTAWCG